MQAAYDTVDSVDQQFFEVLLVMWMSFNFLIYAGHYYKVFYPHWEQVVRWEMINAAQQTLRVPKLTGMFVHIFIVSLFVS